MNVFMGFEQANKYVIMDVGGNHVGYMVEEGDGLLTSMGRQLFRTHRPFKFLVMDKAGNVILNVNLRFKKKKKYLYTKYYIIYR